MTKKYIFKNQKLVEEKQATISIRERGFLFGDGIFETCKISNGKIYDFKSHEDRICKGIKELKFFVEIADLEKRSQQLIRKNQIKNGILRISISRGIGSVGYLPTYESKPLVIIETLVERKLPEKICLGVSKIVAPKTAFKSMNALPYVLNKIAAQEYNFFDCVMLSEKNFIAETSSANIFWVKNGKIFTPAESCGILPGTIRSKLLKISPLKISTVEAKISALKNADEIFLTNSSFLVLPVDEFMGKRMQKDFGIEFLKLLQKDLKESCSE